MQINKKREQIMKKLLLILLVMGFALQASIPMPPQPVPMNATTQQKQAYSQALADYLAEVQETAIAIFENNASNQVRVTYETDQCGSGDFWIQPNNKQAIMPKSESQPCCITDFSIYPYRGKTPIYTKPKGKNAPICKKTITINSTWGTTRSQTAGASVSW